MRGLQNGIRLSYLRARLAQTKAKLAEKPLALAHLQLHSYFLVQKLGQRWAIPQMCI